MFLFAPDRRFLQATQSCDGNLGSDHIYHGRKIDSTFLTVAKQPKNVNTYAIPKLLENISYGLKMDIADIYNPNSVTLKDAVGIFGRGCTGEIISPDG